MRESLYALFFIFVLVDNIKESWSVLEPSTKRQRVARGWANMSRAMLRTLTPNKYNTLKKIDGVKPSKYEIHSAFYHGDTVEEHTRVIENGVQVSHKKLTKSLQDHNNAPRSNPNREIPIVPQSFPRADSNRIVKSSSDASRKQLESSNTSNQEKVITQPLLKHQSSKQISDKKSEEEPAAEKNSDVQKSEYLRRCAKSWSLGIS